MLGSRDIGLLFFAGVVILAAVIATYILCRRFIREHRP